MQRKTRVLVVAAAALFSAYAHALPIVAETEPNDSLATAQGYFAGPVFTIHGGRSFDDPSDDFFSFHAAAHALIEISVTLRSDDLFAEAESAIGLFGPGNVLLASSFGTAAVAGASLGTISFQPSIAGIYTVGFSGPD